MGKTLDDKNKDDVNDGDDGDDNDDGDDDKVFRQEDVDKIAAKARNQARRQTQRELLEVLGVDDVDEAKELLAKLKGGDSGEQGKPSGKKKDEGSEDDALAAALAPFQAQIDDLKKSTKDDIAELKVTNKVEKALIKAGMEVSAAEKARKLVDVERNADDDEIEDAIEELKEEMPELFTKKRDEEDGDDEGDDRKSSRSRDRTPHSNPGSSPRRRKTGKSVQSEARTLLHQRHPRLNQSDK